MNGRVKRIAATAALSLGFCAYALAEATAQSKPDKDVAAEIGGQKITVQEMDDYLHKTNGQAFQAFYDARRAALEQMIAERVMASEAATRKITVEKLQQDVVAGLPAVTDADVQAFYNQNKPRMGAATLDQARPQITAYIAQQRQGKAMSDFIAGLREKAGVRIALEPPRSELRIAEDDPSHGLKDAPIQLIEFSDFQ